MSASAGPIGLPFLRMRVHSTLDWNADVQTRCGAAGSGVIKLNWPASVNCNRKTQWCSDDQAPELIRH
jgi:hypothetical protein